MSSSAASVSPSIKIAPPSNNSTYSQTPATNASDNTQRRAGTSGNSGAGHATRAAPQGRNNQPLRKQHKAQRRARLADEDVMAESAALKSINSRKGQKSITHLMNFALPPRPFFQHPHQVPSNRHQRRNPTWGLGSGYHAIDKARYVHANYRFIVRSDREYHAQTVDADVHVSWDSVLQILASAETQSTSCPICLSTPVGPRMAKCGHIFCLPCLIRYMHSTDETNSLTEKRARWKKCPICEDSIYISETRPVRWFVGQEANMLREGGDVLLKLLVREPGNTLALPRDAAEGYDYPDDIPWFNVAEIMDYSRFMKGGEAYMLSQYDEEIAKLEVQEKEDELMFGDDNTWFRKAVAAIVDAKSKLHGMGDPSTEPKQGIEPKAKPLREPVLFTQLRHAPDIYQLRTMRSGQAFPPSSSNTYSSGAQTVPFNGVHTVPPAEAAGLADGMVRLKLETSDAHPSSSQHTKAPSLSTSNSRPPNHPFFFYHALPNFFLSPLDIRILKVSFGDFSSFPSSILPRVEHISTGHIVDDDLRKRAKYMAHLPYGCEVSFLECDWTDIINPTILAQFDHEIQRRRKRNHEKEAREERERLRAEKEEDDKRWAMARRKRPGGGVEKSFSESDFQPLARTELPLSSSPGDLNVFSMTPPWNNHRNRSSFATLATPGTSPDAPRTVWGTATVAPSSPLLISTPQENSEPPQDDGWLQGWEKDLLDWEDPLNMAVAGAPSLVQGSSKMPPTAATARKKKGKKITIMSTNVRRGA